MKTNTCGSIMNYDALELTEVLGTLSSREMIAASNLLHYIGALAPDKDSKYGRREDLQKYTGEGVSLTGACSIRKNKAGIVFAMERRETTRPLKLYPGGAGGISKDRFQNHVASTMAEQHDVIPINLDQWWSWNSKFGLVIVGNAAMWNSVSMKKSQVKQYLIVREDAKEEFEKQRLEN